MGSGTSRLGSKWWEAEARQQLMTTSDTSKVHRICSLVPGMDEATVVSLLKTRSDLDTLFNLHCAYENSAQARRADLVTIDFKANELWRVFRMSYESLYDWQPPFEGNPSEIAADFQRNVCRAVFQVPFSHLVMYNLGYILEAHSVMHLLEVVCQVSNSLHEAYKDHPEMNGIYIEVEKVLMKRHHPLAYWIVTSSLRHTTSAPYDALALTLRSIPMIFATCNLDLVLERLTTLDRQFVYIKDRYDWEKWSADLDLWEYVDQALWSEEWRAPLLSQLTDHRDEKLVFLKGLRMIMAVEAHSTWRRMVLFVRSLAIV